MKGWKRRTAALLCLIMTVSFAGIAEAQTPAEESMQMVSEENFETAAMTAIPAADDVQITGVFETTEELQVHYRLNEESDPSRTEISWQVATEKDGSYSEFETVAGGGTIILTNAMVTTIDINKGTVLNRRKIRAAVTPYTAEGIAGETVYSPEYETAPSLGPVNRITATEAGTSLCAVHENTPPENVFTAEGKQLILLDQTDSQSSRYFILSKDFYQGRAVEPLNSAWKGYNQNFDPQNYVSDSNNMENKHLSYWINSAEPGGFLDGTEGKLPAAFQSHIDMEHSWKTEANKQIPNDYRFTAGVTLLSLTELKAYADKIGLVDDLSSVTDSKSRWWLRTGYGSEPNAIMFVDGDALGTTNRWTGNPAAIRPVFYLDYEFFTDIKIDLMTAGENIKAILKENYSKEDLKKAGYTDFELGVLWGDISLEKPTVEDVKIHMDYPQIGETASASYIYVGDNEGDTQIIWQQSDLEYEGYNDIGGATEREFEVTNGQSAKYLRVKIVPVTEDGIWGDPYYSEPIKIDTKIGPVDRGYAIENPLINTPGEHTFRVEESDKTFILLDQENGTGSFYVLAKDYYNDMAFDSAEYQRFNPEKEGNIGRWLNTALAEGKAEKNLPKEILAHLDRDHRWVIEAGVASGACPNDYIVKAPIALLSQAEYLKYKEKIGISDGLTKNGWWLRTPRGISGDHKAVIFVYTNNASGPQLGAYDSFGVLSVRPAFYLNRDFFLNVRLDVTSLGEEAARLIRASFTKEELLQSGLYTQDELSRYFGYYECEILNTAVTDGQKPLDNLDTAESVQAEVSVLSRGTAAEYTVIMSVYSAENMLIGLDIQTVSFADGETKTVTLNAQNLPAAEGNHMQITVWDHLSGKNVKTKALNLF